MTNYSRAWNKFVQFMSVIDEPISLPLSQEIIAKFVAYLHDVPSKATTIRQHLSALAYVHKMLELNDKTNTFFIRKLLEVCKQEASRCKLVEGGIRVMEGMMGSSFSRGEEVERVVGDIGVFVEHWL